jgi:hypothetical protein
MGHDGEVGSLRPRRTMIPEHLASTHRMLQTAYPAGLPDSDYFAVIALLHAHMSDRNLAETIALTFGREYIVVWNDTGRVVTTDAPNAETLERVRMRLMQAGYDDWIHEDS